MLYIKTPKGEEAPIVTNNVTIKESLGSLSTIEATFYAADANKYGKPTSYVRSQYVNNHPAFTMISPFAEIVEKGQRFYLQQPQIDDSTDPITVTLSGIQIAKQLHWKYIGKLCKGKAIKYTKTEIIKTRITDNIPYKTKTGAIKYKSKSHIEKSTKQVPAKKIDDKIPLSKLLDFISSGTKIKFKYQAGDENLANKTYSYPDGFGKGYADQLLKKLSQDFDFEYKFDNLTCIIAKKLGNKDSFYFVDRVNCQKINKEENYSNITTRITVYSNPKKTRKASVYKSKNSTKEFKSKSHKEKRPAYKKERKQRNDRKPYRKQYQKKVISINGHPVTSTTKKKTTHGVQYERKKVYTSPLVASAGYPIIEAKTVYLKSNLSQTELEAKAKSLVHDSPQVSFTVTGTNFKAFSKYCGTVEIGNQGLLMLLNGDKAQKARITAIESHPEDDETANEITFGTFRTDPISYQLRQQREYEALADSYRDLNDDVYDLAINDDDFLDLVDDNDAMRNDVGNWHVINYNRIVKNKNKLTAHDKKIAANKAEIEALKAEITAIQGSLTKK